MNLKKIKLNFFKIIKRSAIQSSLGFAIMEVMVAVALLALLSYGVMELLRIQQRGTLSARITSTRDQIASQLARTVGDPRALQATAAHSANTAFNECVIEGPAFVDCDQNVTPLTLLDASGRIIAGPGGVAPTPVIYDEMGVICPGLTSPSTQCPFVVTATFNANCGGPLTCTLAKMVRVEYIIRTSLPDTRAGGALRTVSGDATSGVPLWATNPVGVVNFIPKWGSTTELVTSVIYEDPLGKNIGIGTTTPASPLSVSGDLSIGDSAMTGLFRGIYATKNGTTVIGFDNPGVNDDLAVGMGQNTVFETGMAISNRAVPLSSFFYSTFNNNTNIKAYRGRGIALVVENTAGSTAQEAISILNDDLPNRAFVGIGTNSPTQRLHVNGNLLVTGSITSMVNLIAPNIIGNVTVNGNITATGTITAMSDARLKKNLTPIENSLEKILSLEGLYYNWKDKKRGKERQMGLIAQKTEAIFPEAVRTDDKGMKSINYNSLVAPLIEALREEVHKTKALEEKIKQLEQRLEKLESK